MVRNLLVVAILFSPVLGFATERFIDTPVATSENVNCTPLDFRPQLPVNRSQGDTNFCFAYSSAILLSQRMGVDISALDLATNFYFTDPDLLVKNRNSDLAQYLRAHPTWRSEVIEARDAADISISTGENGRKLSRPYFHSLAGGVEDVALLLANARGLCLESDFASSDGLSLHQAKIDEFTKFAESHSQILTLDPRIKKLPAKFREPIADVFNTRWLNYQRKHCHRVEAPAAALPAGYYAAQTYEDLLEKTQKHEIDSVKEAKKLYSVLDTSLDSGRAAAIGYSLYLFSSWRDATDPYGDHSSAVVARRKIAGQCQYLIRDASGLACSEYYEPYRSRCNAGDFWVTRDELAKSLYSVVYLH